MTIEDLKAIHGLLTQDKCVEAADKIADVYGQKNANIKSKQQAMAVCRSLFQHLLDKELYLHAATLQWGGVMFSAEPESVKRVFTALRDNARTLFCGASSMGKSYNAGVWMYLDWRRDPLYTSVKCVGVSEDQVRKHVFAHIVKLHRACVIPMIEDVAIRDADMWMGVKDAGFEFGITAIAYKQSQSTSGGLKGYKSMAVRIKPHPKFGYFSRLRFLGDEGQNWPGGPFKDLNTTVSQMDGAEMVKIAIAFNPENVSQTVVKLAEPETGWNPDDLELLYDWTSKAGWRVCRLDAKQCENVIQQKKIYEGLQTYEGYLSYLKAGGDKSVDYWCFGRGFPPLASSVNTLISPAWTQSQRGVAVFIETPTTYGAVDLAFAGKDSAQMAIGRWGLACGWTDQNGKYITFKDRTNITKDRPHHVLQIDQIMPLQKSDNTVVMAEEIMGKAKMLEIKPENLVMDKTSIGLGTYSHLSKVWGPIYGVAWNEKATEGRILAEDSEGADKQCDGVMSEMWWAFRRWLDPANAAILINPIIPTQPIHTQMTSRRYKHGARGIKVEPKEEYKSRNGGVSPDEVDSMVMLVHGVRKNSDVLPGLIEQSQPSKDLSGANRVKFRSFKDDISIDVDDSISDDGKED